MLLRPLLITAQGGVRHRNGVLTMILRKANDAGVGCLLLNGERPVILVYGDGIRGNAIAESSDGNYPYKRLDWKFEPDGTTQAYWAKNAKRMWGNVDFD